MLPLSVDLVFRATVTVKIRSNRQLSWPGESSIFLFLIIQLQSSGGNCLSTHLGFSNPPLDKDQSQQFEKRMIAFLNFIPLYSSVPFILFCT